MLKLMPMNIYDVAAQQARMEDQAARGWFAVSVPGIFFLAVFEKGEPKAVRYRLEPAPVKESTRTRRQRPRHMTGCSAASKR